MTLIINNISKKYGQNQVIKDISLTIETGEILGVFGASGAGKSTLTGAIAGDVEIDDGSISFGGTDLTGVKRKEHGFISSASNRFFEKSFYKTENSGVLSDSEKHIFEFENLLKSDHEVLLLDNPFCCLDTAAREENLSKLRKTVKEKNLTVIFATNDFNEIFSICNRVAILDKGEIIQIGTPREVYENPNSAAAAIATGRNNLIAAKRSPSNKTGTPEFQTADGGHRLYTDKTGTNIHISDDENITLAIRPEHISISFGASFPEDNLIRARIAGVKYLGATTLIELDAEGLRLQALVLRLVGLKIGDECVVGLPPARILVLEN